MSVVDEGVVGEAVVRGVEVAKMVVGATEVISLAEVTVVV